MNHFSIRDMENLSGIKAHTLRIWEQRFKLVCPKRKASKHRFYDNEDLKFILRIAFLYNNGHKISSIARMPDEEIKRLSLELKPGAENCEIFINQLMEASIDFDHLYFERILHTCLLHFGFEKAVIAVFFPLLRKIGMLWLTGNVIPAQEHFASALIIKKIVMAIDGLDKPLNNKQRRVLLFTPAGELHEIPLLFMQYLLKKNRVPYVYMGQNVLPETIRECCGKQNVTQLYFHLITNLIRCDLHEYLERLSALFPDKEIFFSGSNTCQVECKLNNVTLLKNPNEMIGFASQ